MHPVEVGENAVLILEHLVFLTPASAPDLIRHHHRPDEAGDGGKVEEERERLSIDAKAILSTSQLVYFGGRWSVATYDGSSGVNQEERQFIDALDRDDAVIWWHRNADRKPWSVRIVRGEHANYFYPDFVVCLEYPAGNPAMTRLVETKESTKDAARKASRVPKIYGKVLFVTKETDRLRIVNDDGSLGSELDWNDPYLSLELTPDGYRAHKGHLTITQDSRLVAAL